MARKAFRMGVAALCLAVAGWASAAAAGAPAAAQVAHVTIGSAGVEWVPAVAGYDRLTLRVSGPDGVVISQEFKPGTNPALSLYDAHGQPLRDGGYTWELTAVPHVAPGLAKQLAAAREAGDDAAAAALQRQAGLASPLVETGHFAISGGAFVSPDTPEPRTPRTATPAHRSTGGGSPTLSNKDQVIADDLIVQGSACVGLDCVNNESFGFDTIRLKENNTRIKFDDTSTGTGFPNHDWQLTANDSASGGANKFSIEDITSSTVPFTITGGATTNSIFVDSTGRVGFRTSTPVLDLHVATGNTPAMRLEQNSSGGFTAQTWDIAGNEANFFIRDVTGGSRLPFRIRPGAPTSSIDINASGNVGIGTASASSALTLKNNTANSNAMIVQRSQADSQTIARIFETTNGDGLLSLFNSVAGETFRFTGSGGTNWLSGTVGLNCNSTGTFDFVVKSGTSSTTACNTGTFSGLVAGSTTFTIASSRTVKENLEPVQVPDILSRIAGIDVYTYDYIDGPKDRLGLMAEDFHQVFGRGSDKVINGQEVEMALWLAVQELTQRNEALTKRLAELEARLQQPPQRQP